MNQPIVAVGSLFRALVLFNCGRHLGGGEFFRRHLAPEGSDLDGLWAESHMREPETAANHPAVLEQALDLVGMCRGADIEVLRPAAEQQIAHAAAHQIGNVVILMKPIEDFERVRIDL
jgi:hypothetical protein